MTDDEAIEEAKVALSLDPVAQDIFNRIIPIMDGAPRKSFALAVGLIFIFANDNLWHSSKEERESREKNGLDVSWVKGEASFAREH